MTGNELIYQIYEDLGINSDDTDVTPRYLIQLINQKRSLYYANANESRRKTLDEPAFQNLQITPVAKVDAILADLGSFDFTSDCFLVRTTVTVPRAISTDSGLLYTRIGPADVRSIEFPYKQFEEINFSGHGRFNSHATYSFWYDDRIYLYGRSEDFQFTKGIAIRGIFEDPIDAFEFNSSTCWTLDSEYPISETAFELIKPSIKQDVERKQAMPDDQTNDGSDEPTPRVVPQGAR